MISPTVDYVKKNAGKTISIATVITVMTGYTLFLQHLDARYCLAEAAQQTQTMMLDYMKRELEDKIFLLELKIEKQTATEEDKAMRHRYLRRLKELNK